MIENPQIKLSIRQSKDYLFPKHSGKFFIQTQKLRQYKVVKNYMPHKVHKQIKHYNDIQKDDYKQMKAEADYIKRIQELKRKLQKEIKRYNHQKKTNQHIVKNLSLSIDRKSSLVKLEQICVNIRHDHNNGQNSSPQNKCIRSKEKRQHLKNIHPIKYHLRNKTQMRKNLKTEESDLFELRRFSFLSQTPDFYSNRTERLSNSQVMKLPPIERRQKSLQERYRIHNHSQHRLSLLSSIDNLSRSVNMTHQNLAQKQSQLINNNYSRLQAEPIVRPRFVYNFSQKTSAKRDIKPLIESSPKPKEPEPLIKGWDIIPETKGFNDSYSIQ